MKKIYRSLRRRIGHLILDFNGRRDAKRFCTILPDISKYERLSEHYKHMLQPYYKEYISEVSTPDMAVSFQASIFLYTLTTIKKPRRILDLGSGFSSFIFRLCSMNGLDIIDIYSVDDNQQWLDKTRSYLIAQGTRSDNMLHWQDFQTLNVSKFDLIFHDLGDMDVRSESLPWVLNLLDRGGIIILDDMHKSNYRASTSRLLSKSGFMRYSMRRYTLDEFGRFLELSMLPAI